jgi:hypothetical protein
MELELIRSVFKGYSLEDVIPRIKLCIRMIISEEYLNNNVTCDEDLMTYKTIHTTEEEDNNGETIVSKDLEVSVWTPIFTSPLEHDIIVHSLSSHFNEQYQKCENNPIYDIDLLRLINKINDEYTIKYFSSIGHRDEIDEITCLIMYKNIKYHRPHIKANYLHQYNLFRIKHSTPMVQ